MTKTLMSGQTALAVPSEVLIYEETRTLPEGLKLVLLGVAKGMALSTDVPPDKTAQTN